jgi:hypothetical protein
MGWTKRGVVRIAKLTAKQEDQIIVFAEKWNKIARSTEPWDEEAIEAGIRRFYKAMGCRQPKRGFWQAESPVGAWNGGGFPVGHFEGREYNPSTFVEKNNPNFWNLGRSEWGIRCLLSRSFEAPVIKQVEDFMHRNVARSLSVWQIGDLDSAVDDHRRSRRLAYGQPDADWLAIADYFATVHNNPHCQKLEGLMQAVASCGFVWLTPNKVVYCNRPKISQFDEQGRLHCEEGVAIRFRGDDGWGFYYLHGVPTPKKWIETPADDLKLEDILAEKNAEVRTAVIRKFGFERLAVAARPRIVSQANGNALMEFKLKVGDQHNEYLRALRLKWEDKTGAKETLLPVPRLARQFGDDCPENVNDCEQVRRWTLGWPKEAMAIAET